MMTLNFPRFVRLGSTEFMWERRAGFLDFGKWFRPSSMMTDSGDWLAWFGPLHIAVSKVEGQAKKREK